MKMLTVSDSKDAIYTGESLDERVGVIEICHDDFGSALGER